jgi:hypothetical protein
MNGVQPHAPRDIVFIIDIDELARQFDSSHLSLRSVWGDVRGVGRQRALRLDTESIFGHATGSRRSLDYYASGLLGQHNGLRMASYSAKERP